MPAKGIKVDYLWHRMNVVSVCLGRKSVANGEGMCFICALKVSAEFVKSCKKRVFTENQVLNYSAVHCMICMSVWCVLSYSQC
jgi:hypothetical protein